MWIGRQVKALILLFQGTHADAKFYVESSDIVAACFLFGLPHLDTF